MNFNQASYLYSLREWEKEAIDDGDEDRLSEINQLKELYKKNGLDEYSDMAFLDENFNFDTDKWYIINMQFCDNTETPREYALEIDEDFDATKLVAVYADVDLGEIFLMSKYSQAYSTTASHLHFMMKVMIISFMPRTLLHVFQKINILMISI